MDGVAGGCDGVVVGIAAFVVVDVEKVDFVVEFAE